VNFNLRLAAHKETTSAAYWILACNCQHIVFLEFENRGRSYGPQMGAIIFRHLS